jgi:hypothetical protein
MVWNQKSHGVPITGLDELKLCGLLVEISVLLLVRSFPKELQQHPFSPDWLQLDQ